MAINVKVNYTNILNKHIYIYKTHIINCKFIKCIILLIF